MGKKKALSRRDVLKTGGAVAVAAAATSLLPEKAKAAEAGVPRWAMVLDMRRCIGCMGCALACKSEYNVALGRWNNAIKTIEMGKYPNAKRYFVPILCNHCAGEKDVPPCVEKCPQAKAGERAKLGGVSYRTGATYKRPDGAILLDMSLCIGCYKCIEACPYGARSIDPRVKLVRPDREKELGVGKCTFCMHRVDKGIVPSCVNTCQGRARIFGDLNDPESEVSKLAKEFNLDKNRDKTTILPGQKTMPHVFYIDPDSVLAHYMASYKKEEAYSPRTIVVK
ncbi:MAG: 4Fe-4S dicluster domain-containing protein [Nitrospirae bacterium]|nr:4Fe-4S dicluster domain-containing protein [Nitrospirota bacterium]